jgi:hypothetical protein
MQDNPELAVRLFLDIQRRPGNTSAASELVREFVHRFRTSQWPSGRPLPQAANFTEAAHQRNIEVGVRLRSPIMAARSSFFHSLVASGHFEQVI